MTATPPFPAPATGGDSGRFWEFLRAWEFRLQRCAAFGAVRHPPSPMCPSCAATASDWVVASGRGEIWSHKTIHPPVLAAFADRVPYNAIVVRLDEGVFLVSNLLDALPPDPVGARVAVELAAVGADLTIPQFRLRA